MTLSFQDPFITAEEAERAKVHFRQRATVYKIVKSKGREPCFFSDIWHELIAKENLRIPALTILSLLKGLVDDEYLSCRMMALHIPKERPCYMAITDKTLSTVAMTLAPALPFVCEEVPVEGLQVVV